jgi:hypothetical protein
VEERRFSAASARHNRLGFSPRTLRFPFGKPDNIVFSFCQGRSWCIVLGSSRVVEPEAMRVLCVQRGLPVLDRKHV